MLDAVVQLKVVVLQRGGGARRQPAVGARAVKQQAGADSTQQDAQGAHDDDGEQDGVQGVQPGVVLVLLRHKGDGGRVGVSGGGCGEGRRPPREHVLVVDGGSVENGIFFEIDRSGVSSM